MCVVRCPERVNAAASYVIKLLISLLFHTWQDFIMRYSTKRIIISLSSYVKVGMLWLISHSNIPVMSSIMCCWDTLAQKVDVNVSFATPNGQGVCFSVWATSMLSRVSCLPFSISQVINQSSSPSAILWAGN